MPEFGVPAAGRDLKPLQRKKNARRATWYGT
jgi:hypothetical protein